MTKLECPDCESTRFFSVTQKVASIKVDGWEDTYRLSDGSVWDEDPENDVYCHECSFSAELKYFYADPSMREEMENPPEPELTCPGCKNQKKFGVNVLTPIITYDGGVSKHYLVEPGWASKDLVVCHQCQYMSEVINFRTTRPKITVEQRFNMVKAFKDLILSGEGVPLPLRERTKTYLEISEAILDYDPEREPPTVYACKVMEEYIRRGIGEDSVAWNAIGGFSDGR